MKNVFFSLAAFQHGNLNGILAPADSRGRLCGVHADVADKHYLFYLDIAKCAHTMSPFVGCETPQVCVSRCPSTEFLFDIAECQQNFDGTLAKLMCQSDAIGQQLSSCSDIERAVNGAQCAKWYLDSQPCKWVRRILEKWLQRPRLVAHKTNSSTANSSLLTSNRFSYVQRQGDAFHETFRVSTIWLACMARATLNCWMHRIFSIV